MLFGTMNPNLGKMAARIAGLLVLAAILGAGVQAAVAEENEMTIAIGDWAGIGTDPTLYYKTWPDIGGWQEYHHYTHWEPLITLDRDGTIVPWLAESYEVSDDYDSITFHLREGITFADGTPLNASILKFNFDRIELFGMNDYGTNLNKQNIFLYYDYSEVLDEYTFKIHFTQGWLDMPFHLACTHFFGFFISPFDVNPSWDIEGMLKPEHMYNGLGPYYVDENESVSGEEVVLKRRHNWRDDYNFHKPMMDKIVLKLIKDSQVAVMALKKGDVDYICRYWNAPLDTLSELETDSDITIKTAPEAQMYLLKTAYWKEPFSDEDGILLRKAICYALDRDELVEGAFNGYAVPATDSMYLSPMRSDTPNCCDKGYYYDLDTATQLLEEAGWKDTDGDGILDKNGQSLKNLNLVISSSSSLSWQKDLALVVQSQIEKIGIDVQICPLEGGAYSTATNSGDYDLCIVYNIGCQNPLSQELRPFYLKKLNLVGYNTNFYENWEGTLEILVDNAINTVDKNERDECICQICNILYEEAGVIPLVYNMQYAVMNRNVNGFEFGPSANGYYLDHVEVCWIDQ